MTYPHYTVSMTGRQAIAAFLATAFVAAAIAFVAALMSCSAHARDLDGRYSNSQYKEWYESQHNAQGQFCCDKSDGHDWYGDYRPTPDGGVEITDGGKVYHLAPYMVLHGPNPTGHAVWWYVEYQGADRVNYCFSEESGG